MIAGIITRRNCPAASNSELPLANDPPLILADEPTGNLDSSNGRHILDLLLQIQKSRRMTLVMVTHDPAVAAVADERLELRDGRPVPATS